MAAYSSNRRRGTARMYINESSAGIKPRHIEVNNFLLSIT
jgi:hypothetical protein